ncbi:hypothetical protein PENTCL1PPCAC_7206, partial [Pristionchus entomophagus]
LDPERSSLDSEAFKPLYIMPEGDYRWSKVPEIIVLEALRSSRLPSSTLFRRGEDGPIWTLATLISWNGRECPFADFSQPERREGVREKKRNGSRPGSSMDENDNMVDTGTHNGSGDAVRERRGGDEEDEQKAVFPRLIAYLDEISERMASIEKLYTEQQSRLAGADIFMKRVASLEMRVVTSVENIKTLEKRLNEIHEHVFFAKRAPMGHSGKAESTLHASEMEEMYGAARRMHQEFREKSEEMGGYKEEVQRVHSLEADLAQRMEVLDGRYSQLVTILAAHERNKDVREAIEEWNKKSLSNPPRQPQQSSQLGFGGGRGGAPLPRISTAIGSVSKADVLDWKTYDVNGTRALLAQEVAEMKKQAADRAVQPMQQRRNPSQWLHEHSDPLVRDRIQGLLMGRDGPTRLGDRVASSIDVQTLALMGSDLRGDANGLTEFMENPRFICHCGSNLQSAISVIGHFNTTKHSSKRPKPLYQSDVNFWINVISNLKKGRAPLSGM